MYEGNHMKENVDYKKRELLIQAAKEEFMKKGYNKASLRNICSKAGMTTGALYFFFENKENLYEEITGSAKNELKQLIKKHIADDKEAMKSITDISEMLVDHSDEADMFIECIYRNYDSFMLILSGSTVALKWTEEINWFVLIFVIFTTVFYLSFGLIAKKKNS